MALLDVGNFSLRIEKHFTNAPTWRPKYIVNNYLPSLKPIFFISFVVTFLYSDLCCTRTPLFIELSFSHCLQHFFTSNKVKKDGVDLKKFPCA